MNSSRRKIFIISILIIISLLVIVISGCSNNGTGPDDGDNGNTGTGTEFLSQTPPGGTPELFAPQIFTGSPELHSTVVFNQNGTELYYSPMDGPPPEIMYMNLVDGTWSEPQHVPFSFEEGAGDPTLSPDGLRLYFLSRHTIPGGVEGKEYIWYAERQETTWGEPIPVLNVLDNLYTHWNVSVDENYNLFFRGSETVDADENIYYSEYSGGIYNPPVKLHENINTEQYNEVTPYAAPDQSYLIFSRVNTSGYASLYISFNMDEGIWSPASNMGINTSYHELYPYVIGNNEYLFLMSTRDGLSRAYWMNAGLIDNFQAEFESTYFYNEPIADTDGWETASLEEVGMNEEILTNLAQSIKDGEIQEIHSIVIIKDGLLVFDEYWDGHLFDVNGVNFLGEMTTYHRTRRHNTHSATKSFTSALVGIALDQGFIGSLGNSIFDYLPDDQDQMNEDNAGITIEDCLKMASGFEWNEWDVGVNSSQYDLEIFNNLSDPLPFLLSKPVITVPGTSFYYNGATVDLLGYIITVATGQTLHAFSRDNLFAPLGITSFNWSSIRAMTCAHGDIYITPRDMAKFGYLFLNNGGWSGTQIISQEYVENSTQFHISPGVNWADGYGYLWWLRNFNVNGVTHESFKAMGWGGQEIFVFRELDMVIVFTGANYATDPPCDYIVRNYILPAIN